MADDKLVCSRDPPRPAEIERVRRFFGFYARCKGLLNRLRRRPGRNACEGLIGAAEALQRARPLTVRWTDSPVPF
jgi:inorganic pyrophosphatase